MVQAALKVKKSVAEKLLHDGAVQCGGRVISQSHFKLQVGDELEIDYAPQPIRVARRKSSPQVRFEILHDDEQVIVVNKPAGLLTVPTPKREKNTLQSQIRKWLERHQPGAKAICVHRLDRLVSGVLIFAKSEEVADALRSQFAARKPERKYAAIVRGEVKDKAGSFRSYLATDEALNRYSVASPEQGELAITHYVVRQRWSGATLIEVRLETGRRNQIRVHLAEAGHPIIGDPRYRPEEAQHEQWPYTRIALHAETLGLLHPASGEPLQFTTAWPQEFRDFRRGVRPH